MNRFWSTQTHRHKHTHKTDLQSVMLLGMHSKHTRQTPHTFDLIYQWVNTTMHPSFFSKPASLIAADDCCMARSPFALIIHCTRCPYLIDYRTEVSEDLCGQLGHLLCVLKCSHNLQLIPPFNCVATIFLTFCHSIGSAFDFSCCSAVINDLHSGNRSTFYRSKQSSSASAVG